MLVRMFGISGAMLAFVYLLQGVSFIRLPGGSHFRQKDPEIETQSISSAE